MKKGAGVYSLNRGSLNRDLGVLFSGHGYDCGHTTSYHGRRRHILDDGWHH